MDIFRRRRRNPWIIPAIILVVAGAGAVIWHFTTSSPKADASTAKAVASATEPTAVSPTTQAPAAPATAVAATLPVAGTHDTALNPAAPSPLPATVPATHPSTMPTFNPGTVMADAQKLITTGDLLAGRAMLNTAIISGTLSAEDQKQAMLLQEQTNKTLIFSPRRFPNDEHIESYTVNPGDMLQKIAPKYSITARFIQRINNIADARKLRAGQTIKLIKGPFHAIVTKSTFTMDIYLGAPGGEGSMYICSLPVGLGQDDSTPTGKWLIEPSKKLMYPTYYPPRGGTPIEPRDPTNPLGDYWLGLSGMEGQAVGKLSYGIHGTIEPDSIGKMASMGCIRMRNEDIALVYEMLVEGKSTVIVKP